MGSHWPAQLNCRIIYGTHIKNLKRAYGEAKGQSQGQIYSHITALQFWSCEGALLWGWKTIVTTNLPLGLMPGFCGRGFPSGSFPTALFAAMLQICLMTVFPWIAACSLVPTSPFLRATSTVSPSRFLSCRLTAFSVATCCKVTLAFWPTKIGGTSMLLCMLCMR